MYENSINQVPKIIDLLHTKGYTLMTAAECVGDDEPHGEHRREIKEKEKKDHDDHDHDHDDDDDEYSEDNFKGASMESNMQAVQQNAQMLQQESSAVSLTYSAVSAALVILGLTAYFS